MWSRARRIISICCSTVQPIESITIFSSFIDWVCNPENWQEWESAATVIVSSFTVASIVISAIFYTIRSTYRKKTNSIVSEENAIDHATASLTGNASYHLHYVPPLPGGLIHRPILSLLKNSILSPSDQPIAVTGTAGCIPYTGLWGMGGIGKTISALILAHDVDVQATFSDGITWLTFGRSANPLALQAQLATLLGDENPTFRNEQTASARLYILSKNRRCLVILDDVWEPQHAEAFSRLGPKCKLLITTRRRAVLERLGAREHQVELLSVDEACKLLASAAGLSSIVSRSPVLLQLIEQCGRLPLAISAIGALIRKGNLTWHDALERLNKENISGLNVALPAYQHAGVLAALDLSIEVLPDDLKKSFLQCAAFPEDASIPLNALKTLWWTENIRTIEVEAAANELVDRTLLMREQSWRFRIHDLYVDILRVKAVDLPSLHAALLDRYRKCIAGTTDQSAHNQRRYHAQPMWHSIPDDGYIHEHMVWHMQMAGRNRDIHELLAEENLNGQSGWYDVCTRRARTVKYFMDVSTAQAIAQSDVINAARVTPYAVSRVVFYGLIKATFVSLASNLPGEFLAELVRHRLLSADDGLLYAQQTPMANEKAVALLTLCGVVEQDMWPLLVREASLLAREITDNDSLLRIIEVAVNVGADDLARETAQRIIRKHENVSNDPRFLMRIKRVIKDDIVEFFSAEKHAWTPYDWRHVQSFVAVQQYLDKNNTLYYLKAIECALPRVWSPMERTSILLALSTQRNPMSGSDMEEIWSEAAMASQREQGVMLWFILNHNTVESDTNMAFWAMRGLVEGVFDNEIAVDVARLLVSPAKPLYARYAVERTRRWALGISSADERNKAVGRIAPLLAPPVLEATLAEALARSAVVGDIEAQVRASCALSGYATTSAQAEALGEVRKIRDQKVRSECLCMIVEHLPDDMLVEALEISKGLECAHVLGTALYAISVRIPEKHLLAVLLEACERASDSAIQAVVERVVARLTEGQRDEVLRAALKKITGANRYTASKAIVPRLSESGLWQVLREIKITTDTEKPAYLKIVFRHLTTPLKEHAFELAVAITDDIYRAKALEALAPDLPEHRAKHALAAVRSLRRPALQADVLLALLPRLREEVMDALAIAEKMDDGESWARVVGAIARRGPRRWPGEALRSIYAAWEHRDEEYVGQALSYVLPYLMQEDYQEVIARIDRSKGESKKAEWFVMMARYLNSELREEMGALLLTFVDATNRVNVVRALMSPPLEGAPGWTAVLNQLLGTLHKKAPDLHGEAIKALNKIERNEKRAKEQEYSQGNEVKSKEEESRDKDEKEIEEDVEDKWVAPFEDIIEMVSRLEGMPREKMLAEIVQRTPTFAKFRGKEFGQETFHVVQMVSRWWP